MVGGLPATGKSTVASALARQAGFTFVRVDRIEQAIIDSTGLRHPLGLRLLHGGGYRNPPPPW